MQIQITEIEPCRLKIEYQADPEQISDKRSEVVSIFKKAPVPGFRPGKATEQAIKVHYKNQIEDSLKRVLAEDAFHNCLFEKKLKPHGPPKFSYILLADGKFNCEFELYTKPSFELKDLKKIDVVKPHEPEQAGDLAEKMMQDLRVKFGESVPYSDGDFVQTGDSVIVNYECFDGDNKIDQLSLEGEMVTVGDYQISSFNDNMLGMSLGETREFNYLVPEGSLPSFVGKTLRFKVTLCVGSKTTPMPLDDTLARKLGKSTISELREFVLGAAQAQISNRLKMALNEAACNKLLDMHDINVPSWLSLSEARYLTHSAKINWDSMPDIDRERFLDIASKNVKIALILDSFRDSEPEAQISDQDAFSILKESISKNKLGSSLEDVLKEMSRTGYLEVLLSRLRDEYTLDYIVKSANIIE